MKLALVAAATMAITALAATTPAPDVIKVGSKPTYAFAKPILNGLGVKSLADLQGRPVMVEFWGVH